MALRGNNFAKIFFGLGVLYVASTWAWAQPALAPGLILVIFLVSAWATWRSLPVGVSLIIAELLVGSKGHLLALTLGPITLPLRIGLVGIVGGIWLIRLIQKKSMLGLTRFEKISSAIFIAYLGIATVVGWFSFSHAAVILDANGWGALICIPLVISTIIISADRKLIEQTVIVGTIWISALTLGLYIGFANGWCTLASPVYLWLRQTGLAEVTVLGEGNVRVFLQSQVYCLLGLSVGIVYLMRQSSKKTITKTTTYIYGLLFCMLISQSRSFWLGAVAGVIALLILAWITKLASIKKGIYVGIALAMLLISQIFLLGPLAGQWSSNIFESRVTGAQQEPATSTRLAQLMPLQTAIAERPLFGFGFGKSLTYISDDPRVRQNSPTGEFATTAFEWGYLDVILKLGIVGLLLYAAWVSVFLWPAWRELKNPAVLGGVSALAALVATNMFSPYLNHPLGFGYLALAVLLIRSQDQRVDPIISA